MVATAGLVELITEPHHSAANAPAVIHTVANTGDKESRKLAFAAPGTFGVCVPAPLRAECSGTLICFRFSVRDTKKSRPLRGGVSR